MKKQAYQRPELRDASNNIVQAGTYGRTSPLVNADNTGVLDYINNNLEALHDAQQTGAGVRAAADSKGQAIDIAALKKLITDTVTQAKKDAILAAHPVGSYYISDKATDPGTLFGGTWEMLAPGLTLISQGKGTDKFGSFEFVAGQTYGERLHQLTVEELPSHGHLVRTWNFVQNNGHVPMLYRNGRWVNWTSGVFRVSGAWAYDAWEKDNAPQIGYGDPAGTTDGTGGNAYHNNIAPCISVYAWRRTA